MISEAAKNEESTAEKTDEDFSYPPIRPVVRRPKLKLIPKHVLRSRPQREFAFEPTKLFSDKSKCIRIKVKNYRSIEVCRTKRSTVAVTQINSNIGSSQVAGVVVASALLNRFRYRLRDHNKIEFPIFGAFML